MNALIQAVICSMAGGFTLGMFGPEAASPFFAATFVCLALVKW